MTKESIKAIVQSKKFLVVATAAISAVGGAAVGYSIAAKRLEAKYSEISEQEIAEAKVYYSEKYKDGKHADFVALAEQDEEEADAEDEVENIRPESEAIKASIKILEDQNYISYNEPPKQSIEEVIEVKKSIKRSNVFADRTPVPVEEFDLDDELTKKHAGRPYIIEQEQFLENDTEHEQVSLTYYEEDDVVADVSDRDIPQYENILGDDNLKFGCGSKDANIVYIRNDKVGIDYEVARHTGSFAEAVHGIVNRDRTRGPRKMKDWED